jgi:hypothetical protein
LSSEIVDDDLDNLPDILHLEQMRRDETIPTTRVPLPNTLSHVDTGISCSLLPNLRHPAGAIAPPFLKRQNSNINILRKYDIVPAQLLQLPMAGGDQNVPQKRPAEITTFLNTKRLQ